LSVLDDDASVKQVIMHTEMQETRTKDGRANQRSVDVPILPQTVTQNGRKLRCFRPVEWLYALKKAHRAAERQQTVEQAGRILKMERGGMIPLSRFNFRVSRRKEKIRRSERPTCDDRNDMDGNVQVTIEDEIPERQLR